MRSLALACLLMCSCLPWVFAFDEPAPSTAAGWQEVMPNPSDLTATTTNDHEVYSFVQHRGLLYIGYYTAGLPNSKRAARLYTWDGKTRQLKYTFGTGLSFASLQALGEYKGALYAAMSGLYNGDGDIYVSNDGGTIWQKSFNATADVFCSSLVEFNGKLYAGMGYMVSRIMAFDGTTWNVVYPGKPGSGLVEWMYVYKGRLYAALGGPNAGRAAIIVTGDGVNWTVDYDGVMTAAPYSETASLVAFKGRLYAGMLKSGTTGGDVLVRDDVTGTWSVAFSNPNGNRIHAMEVYNGRLYIGNANMADAGDVYVTDDGVTFKKDLDTNVREVFRLYTANGSLYMGGGFTNGQARIWRKNDAEALRLDLRSLFTRESEFVRDYVVSVQAQTGDLDAIEGQWQLHEIKIAEAFRPYYGDAFTSSLSAILLERLLIAKRIREAHAQDDDPRVDQAYIDLEINARALAALLSTNNPYLYASGLSVLWSEYAQLGRAMWTARANQDWTAEREAYDTLVRKAASLADTITDALVHQFAQLFVY